MQHVRAIAALDCAQSTAQRLIPKFFALQKDRQGSTRMLLHVPLDDFGLGTKIGIARDVAVQIVPGRDEENLNDLFVVSWTPVDGGPYPDLKGTLTVWSEEDPNRSYLELQGDYEPPLGNVVGEAFDATIGHLIAERTAKQFVEKVADGVSALHAAV
ncbi:MAG TPA: hypothetical protein VFN49_06355 [Candidatus Aquilonibacter sp.]|nr:hypothetical protein [Candidatus Aquilonibacter sp.]